MAATSERAATPTNETFGLAAATWLTLGASALQNGHHGVQNHNTAGLPARLDPLNDPPARVVPVNCSRSSAAVAVGALTRPSARAVAPTRSKSALHTRENPPVIPSSPSLKLQRVNDPGLHTSKHVGKGVCVQARKGRL